MKETAPGRLPQLDARLRCVAQLVPHSEFAADIGADHGRLSCYLLSSGICKKMIVSDISDASLEKSRRLLSLHGLDHRAEFVVADGLMAVTKPVEALVIAGIGGRTIAEIMQMHERIGDARLIISAHTDLPYLREKLYGYGFFFEKEAVVKSGGRFYTVLSARRGKALYNQRDLYIGSNLEGDCLLEYFLWRRDVVKVSRDDMSKSCLRWIDEEIERERGKQSDNI